MIKQAMIFALMLCVALTLISAIKQGMDLREGRGNISWLLASVLLCLCALFLLVTRLM